MAQRFPINNIWIRSISQQIISGNKAKASARAEDYKTGKTVAGRELYSVELIKKNYGIIPLLLIIAGGVCALTGFIVRNTMTRDDVRFRKSGKFGYEEEENFDRERKFLVFNQKYKSPEGLKELYEDLQLKK